MIDIEEKLKRLVEVVQLVASPAEVQLRAFPDFVSKGDEIALSYDECYQFSSELAEEGKIDRNTVSLLDGIDTIFAKMSGPENAELWTDKAIMSNDDWQECRQMARTILEEMGVNARKPDLYWMVYVSGDKCKI